MDEERTEFQHHCDQLDQLEMLLMPAVVGGDWLAVALLDRVHDHRARLIEQRVQQ